MASSVPVGCRSALGFEKVASPLAAGVSEKESPLSDPEEESWESGASGALGTGGTGHWAGLSVSGIGRSCSKASHHSSVASLFLRIRSGNQRTHPPHHAVGWVSRAGVVTIANSLIVLLSPLV